MIKNAIIFKMRCDLGAEQIEQAIDMVMRA